MQISVITPVYNAEKYIRTAVESALDQPEVGEIILIEDKSPDNALEICIALEKKHEKVNLYRHPHGENKGASASRNLGIKKASFGYISFLDADDFFAPNRFKETLKVFSKNLDADGVYEAIGIFKSTPEEYKLYSVLKPIDPKSLFHYLLRGTYGHFSTDGLTIKKSFFERSGYFNEKLPLHQDSELWLRMAFFGKLYPGNLTKPVAYARRHDKNRVTHANRESKLKYWKSVKHFYMDKPVSIINRLLINRQVAKYASTTSIGYYKSMIQHLFVK